MKRRNVLQQQFTYVAPKNLKREFSDTPEMVKSRYESYTEAINYAFEHKGNMHSAGYGGSYDTESWAEVMNYALAGWPDGVTKMQALISKLDISGQVIKPEIWYDVTGDAGIDIGRYLSGEPECMMQWIEPDNEDNLQKSPKAKFVRILLNRATASGTYEFSQRRNAAILALIDALEMAGVSTILDTVDACHFGEKQCEIYIPVKRAGQELTVDSIAFAVSHPRYETYIAFSLITLQGKTGYTNAKSGYYGGPVEASEASNYDLYFGTMPYSERDRWASESKTRQWIVDTLASFGVHVSGFEVKE